MRSCVFGSADPSALVLDPSASKPADTRIAYRFTGEERGLEFSCSPARGSASPGAIRMSWTRGERLGVTFVERRGGGRGVVVGRAASRSAPVRPGDALVRVAGIPVAALDVAAVLRVLRAAPSPCVLELAASASRVTVARPSADMKARGVRRGMELESVDGEPMAGAALDEVRARLKRASRRRPAALVFRRRPEDAEPPGMPDEPQLLRKTHAPGGLSVAAVLAALSF